MVETLPPLPDRQRHGGRWPKSVFARLSRLLQVAWSIGCAVRVTGGWRNLTRHLRSAGGWRPAYGALVGFVALGGRNRERRYRRWLRGVEPATATSADPLAFVVTFAGLDGQNVDILVGALAELPSCLVLVDARSPRLEECLATLRHRGLEAASTTGEVDVGGLPTGCSGVVFLRAGGCPNPQCVGEIETSLRAGAELVYGDADEFGPKGRRKPRFKPDFSIDLLLYQDFISDCVAVRKDTLDRIPAWDFQDSYGTVLQWVALCARITHVPAVLSHALAPNREPTCAPHALSAFLRQRYAGAIEHQPNGWRCRFPMPDNVRITVIVPTRDHLDLLEACIGSLYATNKATPFETVIVDNRSRERETLAWLSNAPLAHARLRVVAADVEFNWSQLNNIAVEGSGSDIFVFLNNDTESVDTGWLARLAEYALRPDVGAVGPMLLFRDGSIQHAGLVVGAGQRADVIYRGTAPDFADHAFVSPRLPRNVAAVTGACLAVRASSFRSLGLFDERFPISGDVEFCLRAHTAGLRNVYAADVVLVHRESVTRGRSRHPEDDARLQSLVDANMPRDPYYSPHLAQVAGVGRGAPRYALLHEEPGRR